MPMLIGDLSDNISKPMQDAFAGTPVEIQRGRRHEDYVTIVRTDQWRRALEGEQQAEKIILGLLQLARRGAPSEAYQAYAEALISHRQPEPSESAA